MNHLELVVETVSPDEIDLSKMAPQGDAPPKHVEGRTAESVLLADDVVATETSPKATVFRIQMPGGATLEDGRFQKVMLETNRLTIFHCDLFAYTRIARHQHVEEQFGYIRNGAIELDLDGESHILYGGDSYFVPSQMPHSLTALYGSKVLKALIKPG